MNTCMSVYPAGGRHIDFGGLERNELPDSIEMLANLGTGGLRSPSASQRRETRTTIVALVRPVRTGRWNVCLHRTDR